MADQEPRWLNHIVRDSALLAIVGATITFLSGFYMQTSYFHGLGIPDWEVDQSPYEYMGASSSFLLTFLFWALVWMLVAYSLLFAISKRRGSEVQVFPIDILSILTAWSVTFMLHKLARIGDETPSWFPFAPGFTLLDAGLYVLAIIAVYQIISIGTGFRGSSEKTSMTLWGSFLGLGLVVTLLLAASLTGQDRANDLVWSCGVHSEIHFDGLDPDLNPTENYTLLLVEDGRYFVRDTAWSGHDRDYRIVPESAFDTALVKRVGPLNDC